MRSLSDIETNQVLAQWGLGRLSGILDAAMTDSLLSFRLPVDSGRKGVLADWLAEEIVGHGECVVTVFDQDVFSSETSDFLYSTFRKGLGDTRPVYESSSFLVGAEDVRAFASVLAMVQYFIWSAVVVDPKGNLIYLSHDETLSLNYADPEQGDSMKKLLESFELESVS